MLIISHPTGTEYVRALLTGCEQAGKDFRFHTTVAANTGDWKFKLAPEEVRKQLEERSFPIAPERIVTHSKVEVTRMVASWLKLRNLTDSAKGTASAGAVLNDFDEHVAQELRKNRTYRLKAKVVHSYEDCALKTFQAARDVKVKTSYELALPYWETGQQLLRDEAKRLPGWAHTLAESRDPLDKLARKTEELNLADVIFCPSLFVLNSLPLAAQKKAVVAEFGSPELSQLSSRDHLLDTKKPLRVLFAGLMSQRKGLADVFEAMRLLNRSDVELVVSGKPVVPMEFYREQYPKFTYEAPKKHRDLLLLMQQCHVLVLPSIVEGRALVQQEAMSCGLPLIVTPNAGGEDLIEPQSTGMLVPIRAPEKIAEAIGWFADHRGQLPLMSEQVRRKVSEYTWENYARKILAVLAPNK